MSEHTPTPWKIDGVYIVASFGPTIADCKKSPSMEIGTARLNAAFIVKAVNSHDALEDVVRWVECWVSNPVGSYSADALNGLFEMTRDRIAALATLEETA